MKYTAYNLFHIKFLIICVAMLKFIFDIDISRLEKCDASKNSSLKRSYKSTTSQLKTNLNHQYWLDVVSSHVH